MYPPKGIMMVYVRKVQQGWRVCVEDRDGFTDWPIQYDNGSIAYDHPFRHSKQDKKDVARTYKALAYSGPSKWAIWEWKLVGRPGSMAERTQFSVARLCSESWPAHGEFDATAERLGYDKLVVDDSVFIGGYFTNRDGDCLICAPRGEKPWGPFLD